MADRAEKDAGAPDSGLSNPEISTKEGSIEVDYVTDREGRAGGFDEKATKALLRKIDWTLIPFLALLYLLSFLDRTNIGNARLAGLEDDLGMDGLDYNVALAVFFPFYVLAEVPSNMAMKRFRPSNKSSLSSAGGVYANFWWLYSGFRLSWCKSLLVWRVEGFYADLFDRAWAICTTLMGIVNSYTGLLISRMALGFAEGYVMSSDTLPIVPG